MRTGDANDARHDHRLASVEKSTSRGKTEAHDWIEEARIPERAGPVAEFGLERHQ